MLRFRLMALIAPVLVTGCDRDPLVQSGTSAGSCQYRHEELPGETEGPSSIAILGLSPDRGARVERNSVLEIDAEYAVRNFEPGLMHVRAFFDSENQGWTNPLAHENAPPLPSPRGRVHLCLDLAELKGAAEYVWPPVLHLTLVRIHPPGDATAPDSTEIITMIPPITFEAAN